DFPAGNYLRVLLVPGPQHLIISSYYRILKRLGKPVAKKQNECQHCSNARDPCPENGNQRFPSLLLLQPVRYIFPQIFPGRSFKILEFLLVKSVYVFLLFHYTERTAGLWLLASIFSFKITLARARLDLEVPVEIFNKSAISLCECPSRT